MENVSKGTIFEVQRWRGEEDEGWGEDIHKRGEVAELVKER
jgi:hypothetical protein